MSVWRRVGSFFDMCGVFFTIQLFWCLVFSTVLTGLILALRKIIGSKRIFAKGMLWAFFLAVPFVGRLKPLYVCAGTGRLTAWITAWMHDCVWISRIYMAGILVAVFHTTAKRLRLRRMIAAMPYFSIGKTRVRVTDLHITPFAAGLVHPSIILPKAMLERYDAKELKVLIRHEQTHIRLGHLWCYLAWDLLRCLLWINPCLAIVQKYFRADLEDICDKVCIQNSQTPAYEYGQILLKSLKLLHFGRQDISSAAAYTAESSFADCKRRFTCILQFKPYKKRTCMGMAAVLAAILICLFAAIHYMSYPRYSNDPHVLVYEFDGTQAVFSECSERVRQMITYDDQFVYVDKDAFESYLHEKHASGEIFIVFGGYGKLPGFGSGSYSCMYQALPDTGRTVLIPYEKIFPSLLDAWMYTLFQYL